MIEKRTKIVNSKRIKANNIRTIARTVYDEYSRFLQDRQDKINKKEISKYSSEPEIAFEIAVKDDIEYSSNSMEVFENGGVLDSKVIEGFTFRFYYLHKASIYININNPEYSSVHIIRVEGDDSTWVNGTFSKLSDVADSWERQNTVYKTFRWPISIILGILGGFFLGWLFTLPISQPLGNLNTSALKAAVFIPIFTIGFMVIMLLFENYINKLWPEIEIVPELEHERKLDKSRSRLKYIVSVIVIPFIISVIVNWFT